MKTKIKYPTWICNDCGIRLGNWYQPGVVPPKDHYATCHEGECDVCKTKKISVTEPRDYGHLIETWKEELLNN